MITLWDFAQKRYSRFSGAAGVTTGVVVRAILAASIAILASSVSRMSSGGSREISRLSLETSSFKSSTSMRALRRLPSSNT